MKRLFHLLVVITVCCSSAALAQKSTQEILLELEASNRAAQIEMEQSRIRWKQIEAESDGLRQSKELENMSNLATEIAERANQSAQDQAEAAKKTEEAVEELRDEMEQSAVKTSNNIYLAVFLLSIGGFVWYIVRRSSNEEHMKENQKFGITAVVCSLLFLVLTVVVSNGWVYRFDLLHNLMSSLRINFFVENDCVEGGFFPCTYLVNFPTKYAAAACLCGAAYGFTTYLGITSPPKAFRKYFEAEDKV